MKMDFEKLGKFYLGKELDPRTKKTTEDLLLYDSKDLTTHAMIIGMTGSGKTGLGIALLEEALMDNIPVIAIDPKGDITNLLLSFPDHTPEDYLPWVAPENAAKAGQTPLEYAAAEARKWEQGLAGWDIGPDRIRTMRNSVDFRIYTPGSDTGRKVNMLGSFKCPAPDILADQDLFTDLVQNTTSTLLALVNIESDPLSGREHLLISKILEQNWKDGKNVDLPMMITQIQEPPFSKIGIMSTDTFYPAGDRFKLALAMNQVLASPSFSQWMTGDPLDIGNLLHTPQGKPRASIFTISHLSDSERMFFVSMLLNEMIGWMRSRSGTSSLRAILYIDEVFGYMPPVKEPPSKKPLLTLLKQARAFGIGVVLSTQNPVDLDYKGLSNMGTWFIGRLQTQRDKDRVLEGLERLESSSGYDRKFLDKAITGLNKREFLLNNVHENSPGIFSTRWVMSYLTGPLTRDQIRALAEKTPEKAPLSEPGPVKALVAENGRSATGRPSLPAEINQFFLQGEVSGENLCYKPMILGMAEAWYSSTTLGINENIDLNLGTEAPLQSMAPDWDEALSLELSPDDLDPEPLENISFLDLPSPLAKPANFRKWERKFKTWIRQNRPLVLYKNRYLKITSEPGETRGDFDIRVDEAIREKRDLEVEKLRQKYDRKMASLQKQLMVAQQAISRESEQARNKGMDTVLSFGSVLAGALLGRKGLSSTSTYRLGSALSKAGKLRKEKMDVERARERAKLLQERIADLEIKMNDEMDALTEKLENYRDATKEYPVRPKSTDINIKVFGLAWVPVKIE
jgi:hypothetical protein